MRVKRAPPTSVARLPDVPEGISAAEKKELRSGLDGQLAVLRELFNGVSKGLLLDTKEERADSLWEELVCLYSTKCWEVLKDLVQSFYQVSTALFFLCTIKLLNFIGPTYFSEY